MRATRSGGGDGPHDQPLWYVPRGGEQKAGSAGRRQELMPARCTAALVLFLIMSLIRSLIMRESQRQETGARARCRIRRTHPIDPRQVTGLTRICALGAIGLETGCNPLRLVAASRPRRGGSRLARRDCSASCHARIGLADPTRRRDRLVSAVHRQGVASSLFAPRRCCHGRCHGRSLP